MTEERLVLAALLEKAGEGDFLRALAEAVLQLLMESDVEGLIGAGLYERSGERTTWRNGYRDRTLDARLGALQLRIPKLRQGSYFPPFLEARKSSERVLIAVIQEAWISGVSTRRVDDLVQAMGLSGISNSQVSKLCKEIDERVHAFLDRPLAGEVALSVAQRHLPEAARGRPHRLGRRDNRRGREHRWQTRDRFQRNGQAAGCGFGEAVGVADQPLVEEDPVCPTDAPAVMALVKLCIAFAGVKFLCHVSLVQCQRRIPKLRLISCRATNETVPRQHKSQTISSWTLGGTSTV
jgi:hypothetical protein